jgi:anti-sigma B factor antagonist
MTDRKLAVSTRSAGNFASVVDIAGDVTADAENALADAYTQAATKGVKAVILNFEKMEYMNSSGIGLLVTLLIRAQRQGQSLLAVGLNDHYQHIFQLTRLNEAIQIFDSESAAMKAIKS